MERSMHLAPSCGAVMFTFKYLQAYYPYLADRNGRFEGRFAVISYFLKGLVEYKLD